MKENNWLTIQEAVEVCRFPEIVFSADATLIAFVIDRPSVSKNNISRELVVYDTVHCRSLGPILTARYIKNIQWAPMERTVTCIAAFNDEDRVVNVDLEGNVTFLDECIPASSLQSLIRRGCEEINHSGKSRAIEFAWLSDTMLVIASPGEIDDTERQNTDLRGYIYDDSRMYWNRGPRSWIKRNVILRVLKLGIDDDATLIVEAPDLSNLSASPSRKSCAFILTEISKTEATATEYTLCILRQNDLSIHRIHTSLSPIPQPFWMGETHVVIHKGVDIAVFRINSTEIVEQGFKSALPGPIQQTDFVQGSTTGAQALVIAQRTRFVSDGLAIYSAFFGSEPTCNELSLPGLAEGYSISGVSRCGISADGSLLCASVEGPNTPPELFLCNLAAEFPSSSAITALNGLQQKRKMAHVSKRRWISKTGAVSDGFILNARAENEGTRPIICVIYANVFLPQFMSQPGFMPNYPLQSFVENGFIVIIINAYPSVSPASDEKKSEFAARVHKKMGVAMDSLSVSIQDAVDNFGGDASRVGMCGVSHGGFLTHYAMTQTDLIAVASTCEGGSWNLGWFWNEGSAVLRNKFLEFFEGAYFEEAAFDRYKSVCPSLKITSTTAPLMQEHSAVGCLFGLEMHEALQSVHVPSHFVIYSDETHVMFQPGHRYWSMRRNLAWFNLFLRNVLDEDFRDEFSSCSRALPPKDSVNDYIKL